ncbi:unnamed protein product, partial [marine sediment metagenome]
LNNILMPDCLNTPENAFDYAISFYKGFLLFLDKEIGVEKRIELIRKFYKDNNIELHHPLY